MTAMTCPVRLSRCATALKPDTQSAPSLVTALTVPDGRCTVAAATGRARRVGDTEEGAVRTSTRVAVCVGRVIANAATMLADATSVAATTRRRAERRL